MCSADEEGRSFSQRQEGTQSHPSRAGQDLFWDLKSVHHGSTQDWRVLEEEAEERDGLDCVMQRFWILCQYAGEPQKSFEQARSIQICELELFGNCGNGKKMVSTLFMKCVAFPMAAICFSYCFPPFQDFFFLDRKTSLFHSSSTSVLWTKFQRDPGQMCDMQLFLCVD